MRAGSRWKRTPFPASPVGGIAPLASGRQTRPRIDRDRANLGRRPGANKGLRRLWEISAGCLGREPYRSTGWPASRKPCSRPCGSEFTGSVGVSCCGFKASAQTRCFPGAQGFVPPPPHGFRFARGTPPDPSYESPCAPHGDALDEEVGAAANAPPGGRTQSLRRGTSGMDAARGAPGHGWPIAPAPRRRLRRTHFSAARRASVASNGDGVREPWRSRGRMMGQALLVPFEWFGIPTIVKRDSPGRAKPKAPAELDNQLGSKPSGNTQRRQSQFIRDRCRLHALRG